MLARQDWGAAPCRVTGRKGTASGFAFAYEMPLARDADDQAFTLQDRERAGRHAVRDAVVQGDRMDGRDATDQRSLRDLVAHDPCHLLIRRHRRLGVDHIGQLSVPGPRWQIPDRPDPEHEGSGERKQAAAAMIWSGAIILPEVCTGGENARAV